MTQFPNTPARAEDQATIEPLARSLAQLKRAVEARLSAHIPSYNLAVLTQWLRGHEHYVAEITAFTLAADRAALDVMETVLAALPLVYRTVRITEGRFGRKRDLRWQVRALMAMNSFAFERQPLGRGGWAEPNPDHPGIKFRNPLLEARR
jgi:hypothetical protein